MAKRKAVKAKAAKGKVAKRKVAVKHKATKKPGQRKAAKPTFTVFITWSGDESKYLGNRLRLRLPIIVPKLKVIFSPTFAPGAPWIRKVQNAIQHADYAILCVTKESLESRWMNFEAGASWKALKQSNICPLLLNMEPSHLLGPLALFQAKQFNKADIEDLCRYFARKTRLGYEQFKNNFDGVWPTLREEVLNDLKGTEPSKTS